MIFRIRYERHLRTASGALQIEPENSEPEIGLVLEGFLSHVELCPDIHVVTTGLTSDGHRQHHSNIVLFVFGPSISDELAGVEVRRVVLVEDLSDCHNYKDLKFL